LSNILQRSSWKKKREEEGLRKKKKNERIDVKFQEKKKCFPLSFFQGATLRKKGGGGQVCRGQE